MKNRKGKKEIIGSVLTAFLRPKKVVSLKSPVFFVPLVILLHTTSGCFFAHYYGLEPLYPPMPTSNAGRARAINSLTPTFSWKPWDPPQKLTHGTQEVTYDLLVLIEDKGWPGEVIYERKALSSPSHTIEVPLNPATTYYWSVRARFSLHGKTRVTHWSGQEAFLLSSHPSFLFKFKTPNDI